MALAADVAAALATAGRPFGAPPPVAPRSRWGALWIELDAGADDAFAVDIELIYEGYLQHYREGRIRAGEADDLETRLLAGDCFYARGLRGIAARGDAEAVGLLARLMASCAYLRSVSAPYSADDALWAYTMAGLAAQHAGDDPARVAALFDDVEAGFGEWSGDVSSAVREAATALTLLDPTPLLRELDAVAGR